MDNRLTQLMYDSGLIAQGAWDSMDQYQCDAVMKFAELIIEDCANLFPLAFTDEQYQRRIDKTIRKHFGINDD